MDAIALLRAQYNGAHDWLEATLGEITSDQAHWCPPGKATPIAAQYAHMVTSEDGVLNGMLKGSPPLLSSTWAGKAGLSEPPPEEPGWEQWARRVKVDLGALREYSRAVYAATDAYLASLAPADLDRPFDLSSWGMGQQTVAVLLCLMLEHVGNHCGEISCLKGLQGATGYPA